MWFSTFFKKKRVKGKMPPRTVWFDIDDVLWNSNTDPKTFISPQLFAQLMVDLWRSNIDVAFFTYGSWDKESFLEKLQIEYKKHIPNFEFPLSIRFINKNTDGVDVNEDKVSYLLSQGEKHFLLVDDNPYLQDRCRSFHFDDGKFADMKDVFGWIRRMVCALHEDACFDVSEEVLYNRKQVLQCLEDHLQAQKKIHLPAAENGSLLFGSARDGRDPNDLQDVYNSNSRSAFLESTRRDNSLEYSNTCYGPVIHL